MDIKSILAKTKAIVAKSSFNSVSTNVNTKSYTTNVAYKSILTNVNNDTINTNETLSTINADISIVTPLDSLANGTQFNVILDGYGEEAIPQLTKIAYQHDASVFQEYLRINLSFNIVNTFNSIETVRTNLNKKVIDSSSVYETLNKQLRRAIYELYYVSDSARLSLSRAALLENFSISLESLRLNPKKVNVEVVSFTFALSLLNIRKNLVETLTLIPIFKVNLNKIILHQANITEILSFTFRTNRYDNYVINDDRRNNVRKNFYETSTTSDTVSLLRTFGRSFQDYIYPVDDFYGEANIDDDQYASVLKRLVDTYNTVERFVKNCITYRFDQYTTTDLLKTAFSKKLVDTSTVLETLTKAVNSKRLDTVVTSESLIFQIHFYRYFNDLYLLSETVKRSIAKVFSESYTLTESATKNPKKVFTDNTAINEASLRNPKKQINEVTPTYDSGTVYNQGYFLGSDYVEVGYVGTRDYF